MNRVKNDILMHYGRSVDDGAPGPGSGRYPKGSGEDPNQHSINFAERVQELKKSGMDEKDIAKAVGCKSTTELRSLYKISINDKRSRLVDRAMALKADGKTRSEIARLMGVAPSTVDSYLNADAAARSDKAKVVAEYIKKQVDEKGMVDVGKGTEIYLGISEPKLGEALQRLKLEGYIIEKRSVPQGGVDSAHSTTMLIACRPDDYDKTKKYNDPTAIKTLDVVRVREDENGNDFITKPFEYPASMDSSRLAIRYAEDGGKEKDGVVEIRRGLKDLNLGNSNYAQVRILVDGNRYIKGMCMYSDDLPEGVDCLFNTNKSKDVPKLEVLKAIKNDPTNPFGANLREEGGQSYYTGDDGKQHLNLINKTRVEGDWGAWEDSLSSQFLSKQPVKLIKQQLDAALENKKREYNDILALECIPVKRALLEEFADSCSSDSVELKGAALPRQRWNVILPVPTLNDNEVYAPNFKDGETLALIRYPHAGQFEIVIAKNNTKHSDGTRLIGKNPADAIGISPHSAEKLSGADFDGDTVLVIPCNSPDNKVKIHAKDSLRGLEGFDPKMEYPERPGMKYMKRTEIVRVKQKDGSYREVEKEINHTGKEMGMISNLITDMTLKGASDDELARAVRHSMVVIDAAKHKLDYERSFRDNRIAELKKKYQGHYTEDGRYSEGASTLISRASAEATIRKRKGAPKTDPETGDQIYKTDDEFYYDKKGNKHYRQEKTTQMQTVKDAHALSTGRQVEEIYANYANALKDMERTARLELLHPMKLWYNSQAKKEYSDEVQSLKRKLNDAKMNAPIERQAQLAAAAVVKGAELDNPFMSKAEKKKMGQRALSAARRRLGAHRRQIDITDREWEAIQRGAISDNTFQEIYRFCNKDDVRERSTPKSRRILTTAQEAKIRSMKNNGKTTAQIADALGVSVSTISKAISGN